MKQTKRQAMGGENAGVKAEKLADAPETKARFQRIFKELVQSFAGIFGRTPSEEEGEALRRLAQVSAAFLAMADDAGESAEK